MPVQEKWQFEVRSRALFLLFAMPLDSAVVLIHKHVDHRAPYAMTGVHQFATMLVACVDPRLVPVMRLATPTFAMFLACVLALCLRAMLCGA